MPINTEHRSKDDAQRLERLHNTKGKVEDVAKRGAIYLPPYTKTRPNTKSKYDTLT